MWYSQTANGWFKYDLLQGNSPAECPYTDTLFWMEHLSDSATFLVPNINSWRKLCCHVGSAVFDQLSPGKTFTSCRFRSTLLTMCPEAGPYDIAIMLWAAEWCWYQRLFWWFTESWFQESWLLMGLRRRPVTSLRDLGNPCHNPELDNYTKASYWYMNMQMQMLTQMMVKPN